MSRLFKLKSGTLATNMGPDNRLGPSYTQRADGTFEEDPKGSLIKLQMQPPVPQRFEYVRWSNIKQEITAKGERVVNLTKNLNESQTYAEWI